MPHHPTNRQAFADRNLLEHLNGATHVRIRCRCSYAAIWLTADLVERCPGAVKIRDFSNRLRCKRCNLRGWALFSAAGR